MKVSQLAEVTAFSFFSALTWLYDRKCTRLVKNLYHLPSKTLFRIKWIKKLADLGSPGKWPLKGNTHIHTYNRFTAIFWDHPGELMPEKEISSGLYGAKGDTRGRHIDNPAGCHSIRTNQRPISLIPPTFTPDALPAATLTIYPGLGQAPNTLACTPSVIFHCLGKSHKWMTMLMILTASSSNGRLEEITWTSLDYMLKDIPDVPQSHMYWSSQHGSWPATLEGGVLSQRWWRFEFELRFYIPLNTKYVISETFFPADLLT